MAGLIGMKGERGISAKRGNLIVEVRAEEPLQSEHAVIILL